MQKQAPSLGRILVMVLFALSCFGLLLFLWLSFGGPVPLKPKGYQVKVAFPEATQLGEQADVRVAGVSVGKVTEKTIDPKQPNRTIATLEIDRKFAPIAKDTKRDPAPEDAAGRDVRGAHAGQRKAAGDGARRRRAGRAQRRQTVELDEIFQAFDPQTRRAFRTWQQTLAPAIAAAARTSTTRSATCPRSPRTAPTCWPCSTTSRRAARLVRNTGDGVQRAHPERGPAAQPRHAARARRSTRPRRARRRSRRRSRSSRRSSTSPRPRSRAWRSSPRTPTR